MTYEMKMEPVELIQRRWIIPSLSLELNQWNEIVRSFYAGGLNSGQTIIRCFHRDEKYQHASATAFNALTLSQLPAGTTDPIEGHVSDFRSGKTRYRQINPQRRQTWDEEHPPGGKAILHVMMYCASSALREFSAWYNEEHLPALTSVKGVLSGRRFSAIGNGPSIGGITAFRYLAFYELADPEVVDGSEFEEAGLPTQRRKAIADSIVAHVQRYLECPE